MTVDFFNINEDNIFIAGNKKEGYDISLYSEDGCITLSYNELRNFRNKILEELEKCD